MNCYCEVIKEKKMFLVYLCFVFNNLKWIDLLFLVCVDIVDDIFIIVVFRNLLVIVKDVYYMVSDEISN